MSDEFERGHIYVVDRAVHITAPILMPSLDQWKRMPEDCRDIVRGKLSSFVRWCVDALDHLRKGTAFARHSLPVFDRIEITRHSPRKLTHKSLSGGARPLVRAMMRADLIADDADQIHLQEPGCRFSHVVLSMRDDGE